MHMHRLTNANVKTLLYSHDHSHRIVLQTDPQVNIRLNQVWVQGLVSRIEKLLILSNYISVK